MRMGVLFAMTAGTGVLVSPDHLRLWGNLAGQAGVFFWPVTMVAAGLYVLSAYGYLRLAASQSDGSGYLPALYAWGGSSIVAVAVASRLVLLIGLLTGILVTAGFVFNETFVYWFPNFGFAFLCLAMAGGLHLWGYRVVEGVQIGLLTIVLAGLTGLIVAGYWQMASAAVPPAAVPAAIFPAAWCGAMLLFVGFDLGFHRSGPHAHTWTVVLAPLLVTVPLLGLWGAVSQAHVPADRLAGSFPILWRPATSVIKSVVRRSVLSSLPARCAPVWLFFQPWPASPPI